jgi:hypothetical protein
MRCVRGNLPLNSASSVEIHEKTAGFEEIFMRLTVHYALDRVPSGGEGGLK